jgi:hypothetical protein
MPTIEVQVRRVSVVSSRPFEEIVQRLTATIGHPDMNTFPQDFAGVESGKLHQIRLDGEPHRPLRE